MEPNIFNNKTPPKCNDSSNNLNRTTAYLLRWIVHEISFSLHLKRQISYSFFVSIQSHAWVVAEIQELSKYSPRKKILFFTVLCMTRKPTEFCQEINTLKILCIVDKGPKKNVFKISEPLNGIHLDHRTIWIGFNSGTTMKIAFSSVKRMNGYKLPSILKDYSDRIPKWIHCWRNRSCLCLLCFVTSELILASNGIHHKSFFVTSHLAKGLTHMLHIHCSNILLAIHVPIRNILLLIEIVFTFYDE